MLTETTQSKLLQQAIDNALKGVSLNKIRKIYKSLELSYRSKGAIVAIESADLSLAYLAVRMMPIYFVISGILKELQNRSPDFEPRTHLDVGSGPGTVLWAANSIWPNIKKIVAVEREDTFIRCAKGLIGFEKPDLLEKVFWERAKFPEKLPSIKSDLVTLSYVLGEINNAYRLPLIQDLWQRTAQFLLIVEPGTPEGFQRILEARKQLCNAGAYVWAPCYGNSECHGKWCHFSERVRRSQSHCFVKDATLGYEDEHFSYLLVGRAPSTDPAPRVIGSIRKLKHQITVPVCGEDGLPGTDIVSRRESPEKYRTAAGYGWGIRAV
jgi:ribosomal protein RSM22 (predicted rRNA methylase)